MSPAVTSLTYGTASNVNSPEPVIVGIVCQTGGGFIIVIVTVLDNMLEVYAAAVKVDTSNIPVQDQDGGTVTNEIKASKLEGSLQLNFDNDDQQFGLRTKVAGGYQAHSTFKQPQDQSMDTTKKESCHFYIISNYIKVGL